MSPAARQKARRLALQALYQWQMADASLSSVEAEFREDNDMKVVDQEYFCELLHRIPAQVSRLDDLITPHLDRALNELTPIELTILRIGAYELADRKDVPYKVIINEGVNLTKAFGATDGHKYVNGVLDKLARELRSNEI
ncbi:MAG: transcription antitermination factor NusB [Pseudomonadales bacterium]|nr:transcription antitermination factor NusB [Pseudomonadales bacterium]